MPKKVEEKLYILCPSRAYLAPVKMMGPIVHPVEVTKLAAVEILMTGADVFEYIPATKDTFKLTLENINKPSRYDAYRKETVVTPVVEPVKRTGVPKVEETKVEPAVDPVVEEPKVEEPFDTLKDEKGEEIDVPAGDVNDEPAEIVVEAAKESVVDSIEFAYKEDGTIDETNIEWSSYSKNDRKAIRAFITEHNASVANK